MRLIDADALSRAIKIECNPYGKPTIDFESGKKVLKIIDDAPTVEPKRKFIRIITTYCPDDCICYKEYKGKPYFSIEYECDGELHCGYSTYDIDVLSRFLRDYFFFNET